MRPPSAHTARVRHSGRRPPRQSRRASVVGFFRLFSPVPRESRSLAIVAAACLHLPHVSMGDLSPFGALFGALALRLRATASGAGVGRWLLGHPLRGRLHFLARYGVFKVPPPGFGFRPRRADGLHYAPLVRRSASVRLCGTVATRGHIYARDVVLAFPLFKGHFQKFFISGCFLHIPSTIAGVPQLRYNTRV